VADGTLARFSREDAEEFTAGLADITAGLFKQIALGIKLKAPEALGMARADWAQDRLGGYALKAPEERREAVAELVEEGLNNSEIADALGVDEGTVRNDKKANSEDSGSGPLDTQGGSEDSESLEDRHPEPTGEREVVEAVPTEPKLAKKAGRTEYQPDIRRGDFREVLADLGTESVDLIFTDPPYSEDSIPLYRDLGEFASRVLRPGGSLLCYSGQHNLIQVGDEIGAHLRYWWTLALRHSHGGQRLPGKWVIIEWKPILWFVKDYRASNDYIADSVAGTLPDKDAHEWAQGEGEARYLIRQLTDPGALVVDPFSGSGTTGRAALGEGRRFIGAEIA
jgi:transposase-like protein